MTPSKKNFKWPLQMPLIFLRERLSNDLLQFTFLLSKESTATEYAYTPEEKYQKLAEKYPQVEALRKHFNLDL
jgi:hypothetical protein